MSPRRRVRAGFSMVEMLSAMTLMLLVLSVAIPFFRVQVRVMDQQSGRMDAVQNTRFANTIIDREVRAAGGETGQPVIVQAGPMALTFNVDLTTRVANDPRATYFNPDADSLATEAWLPANARTLPLSAKSYPAVLYTDPVGNRSGAETISYFLRRDSLTTGRNDVYTLFRRVNNRDSTVVARNLIIPADTAYFFRYQRVTAAGTMTAIPRDSVTFWDSANRWADSIRVVEIRAAALYRDVRLQRDVVRTVYSQTRLLNAGLLQQRFCGTAPLPPRNVTTTLIRDSDGNLIAVRVRWNDSLEEAGGERDVSRYLVRRQPQGGSVATLRTLISVAATADSAYTYDDTDFELGNMTYSVAAQDCSPANSSNVASNIAVVP